MNKYRVLVRDNDYKEIANIENLDYKSAIDKFKFFIDCTLAFNMKVRVINLIKGKTTIKMFENQTYNRINH